MSKDTLPTHLTLMTPLIQALKGLGGSGSIEEINNKAVEIIGLPDEDLEIIHDLKKGGMTEIEYRLAWSRSWLKIAGYLENSSRGIWALTSEGNKLQQVDEREVGRRVRGRYKEIQQIKQITEGGVEKPDAVASWRDELLETLLRIQAPAFERLIQRVLRESGFVQVEVTGRSGDGGIDGKGIIRIGGMLSFHVIFQCKKWQGTITPSQVRDFRGAMVGRADKGLLVTTGTFSKEALKEATRDGTPAIDLIDGEQLLDKLKELSLGVHTEKVEVEQVTIDRNWFAGI